MVARQGDPFFRAVRQMRRMRRDSPAPQGPRARQRLAPHGGQEPAPSRKSTRGGFARRKAQIADAHRKLLLFGRHFIANRETISTEKRSLRHERSRRWLLTGLHAAIRCAGQTNWAGATGAASAARAAV